MELEYSQASPSLATFNNNLWVAFLGKSSNDIYACPSSDGLNWSSLSTDPVNQKSSSPPSLCQQPFNNKLWMAFRGDTSNDVYVCSFDGKSWSDANTIGQTTKAAPALAVFQGKLWVAFIAQNSSGDILLCSSSDGKNWSPNMAVPGQSSAMGPSLAVFNGQLWLAFIAQNGSNDILVYYSANPSTDPKSWVSSPLGQQSFASPSLSVVGNTLWVAFTGNTSSDLRVCSLNGNKWSANTAIASQTSSAGPALTAFPPTANNLKVAFLSADVSDRLFTVSSAGPESALWGSAFQIGNYPDQITLNAGTAAHTISYGGGHALGVNPNQAQFFATLVLNSNGSCTFSGTYTNNGSIPVLTAYAQNYSVAIVIMADGIPFAFEHSGTAQNANHDSWSVTTTNNQIAAFWPAIVTGTARANSTNNAPPAGILSAVWGALGDLVSAVETVAKDVITVLGYFGGSDDSGGDSGGAAVDGGGD
jgi:hypothetical protein